MAIALRGALNHFTTTQNNGNDVTLTLDTVTPPLEDDIIVVFGGHAATDTAALAAPIGNTSGNFIALGDHSGTAPIFGAWYQRMGATPDTSVVCDGGGNNQDGVQYGCWVISGVDTTTALDVTTVTVGPTTSTNPNCGSITPPTDDAWVFAMAGSEVRDTSPGTVSGYTNQLENTRQEAADQTVAGATFDITTNGGSAEDPAAWDAWLSGAWYAITAAFKPAVAGGQGINVTQATETNIAQAITIATAFTLAVGLATETDLAQAVSVTTQTNIVVGQVTETDLSQAVTVSPGGVTIAVGQSLETDIAQAVTVFAQTSISVVQALESDTSQAITVIPGGTTIAVGQSTETDTAQAVTVLPGGLNVAVGQSTETDLAQAVTITTGQSIATGQAVETDLAQVVTLIPGGTSITANQAVESDTAQAVTVFTGQVIAVIQAFETDVAQAVTAGSGLVAIVVGQSAETDIAQTLAALAGQSISVAQVIETDLAQAVTVFTSKTILAGQAVETDLAQAINVLSPITIVAGQATELDIAQSILLVSGPFVVTDEHILTALNPSRTLTASDSTITISIQTTGRSMTVEEP